MSYACRIFRSCMFLGDCIGPGLDPEGEGVKEVGSSEGVMKY